MPVCQQLAAMWQLYVSPMGFQISSFLNLQLPEAPNFTFSKGIYTLIRFNLPLVQALAKHSQPGGRTAHHIK